MNNKGFEFSFAWMFSLIVGAVILFLAIYAANSLIKSERNVQDTLSGRELEILLNPLETQSFEAGVKPRKLEFQSETRLSMRCSSTLPFGTHSIAVSTKSGVGEAWGKEGVASTIANKYIFSESLLEGKSFSVLVKPFNLPYKVSDTVLVWNDEYCFVNPPNNIQDEIFDLGLNESGLYVASSISECPTQTKSVCFSSSQCDVSVDLTNKQVSKKGETVRYNDDLIYAAILSDPMIYNCELKRLLLRSSSLAEIYKGKSQLLGIQEQGCSVAMQPLLTQLGGITLLNSTSSKEDVYASLTASGVLARELDNMNEQASCKLWGVA